MEIKRGPDRTSGPPCPQKFRGVGFTRKANRCKSSHPRRELECIGSHQAPAEASPLRSTMRELLSRSSLQRRMHETSSSFPFLFYRIPVSQRYGINTQIRGLGFGIGCIAITLDAAKTDVPSIVATAIARNIFIEVISCLLTSPAAHKSLGTASRTGPQSGSLHLQPTIRELLH